MEKIINNSLNGLTAALKETYAILPLPQLSATLIPALKPAMLAHRVEARAQLHLSPDDFAGEYVPVPDINFGIRLTKTIIAELRSLMQTNTLHETFAVLGPKPFFSFQIAPRRLKHSFVANVHGKPESEDFFLPRILREGGQPSSERRLIPSSTGNHINNIISRDEECQDETVPVEMVSEASLLAQERLGWTSVGQDDYTLQLKPALHSFEEKLQELIDHPLKVLLECPKVTSVLGTELIVCRHYQPTYVHTIRELTEVVTYSLYGPLALLAILRQFEYLIRPDQQTLLDSLISSHLGDYAGLNEELGTITQDLQTIQQLPNQLQFGAISVDLKAFKRDVDKNANRLVSCLLEELQLEHSGLLHQAGQMFRELMQRLRKSPQNVEELQVVNDYLKAGQDAQQFAAITGILEQAEVIQIALAVHCCPLTVKQLEALWGTKVWGVELRAARTRAQMRINKVRPGFIEAVQAQAVALKSTHESLYSALLEVEAYADLQDTDTRANKVTNLLDALTKAQAEVVTVNFRQRVLLMEETDFADFQKLLDRVSKHESLWTLSRDWLNSCEEWTQCAFRIINGDFVSNKYHQGSALVSRLVQEFANQPASLQVAEALQVHMQGFKDWVTLIAKLRHSALKDRHWTGLLASLGGGLTFDSLTLKDLMKAGILEHMSDVNKVFHEALNEQEIEKTIAKIESDNRDQRLKLEYDPIFPALPYILGLDDCESAIMEKSATLTFILNHSKHALFFKSRLEKLRNYLTASAQIVKDVGELQNGWQELYPLLQLPEIAKALEKDKQKMGELHDFYVRQAEGICGNQGFAVFTEVKIKSHTEANEILESLAEKVDAELRKMADNYPRLLFLSRKELKRLLGNAARQGIINMSALYPGIGIISLKKADISEVTRGGNVMSLSEPVSLKAGDTRFPVEFWLRRLDLSLNTTFQSQLSRLVQAAETETNWWQSSKDTQLMSVVQHILFTQLVFASAMTPQETIAKGIESIKKNLFLLINEIRPVHGTPDHAKLVIFKQDRELKSKLVARTQLERLVLIMLQQLHLLNTAYEDRHLDWEDIIWKTVFKLIPEAEGRKMKVTFFDYTKAFGFEWLPLPIPLFVSTPITERCMLNMVCALKNNSSGLLHGGSGYSKSETLKEMAMMYGRSVLSITMARGTQSGWIISALIGCFATGTWLCFEEIHHLEPMLLNTLIAYLPRVCEAQRVGHHEISIDGERVSVQEGFAFWGMSTQPRIRLPVRFMECFRCVSLVQPDLAAVAELRLYALGLSQAREVSRRIARALTFLSDDCSSILRPETSARLRTHSVKILHKIINSIATTLDNFPVPDNNYLISNALARVFQVGLSTEETALFEEFLTTVFRAPHNHILAGSALTNESVKMKEVLQRLDLSPQERCIQVMRGFWLCVSEPDRTVVLLTGPAGSGKTTLMKSAATAYSEYANESFRIHFLSGQISHWNLFELVKVCSSAEPKLGYSCKTETIGNPTAPFTPKDWICIDSTTVDSDGLLAVARNEIYVDEEIRVNISKYVKVIAESESLATAVPSLLSEATIIYCQETDIPDLAVFKHMAKTKLSRYETELMRLFQSHYERVMALVEEDQVLHVSRRVSQLLICNWLCLFLSPKAGKKPFLDYSLEVMITKTADDRELPTSVVQVAWLLSLISCLGRISKNRAMFSDLLLRLCKEEDPSFAHNLMSYLSKKRLNSIFDMTFNFEQRSWCTWQDLPESHSPNTWVPQLPSASTIFVETDTTRRLRYRIEHALRTRTNFVVVGPHQCGKSLVLSRVLRDWLSRELVSILPIHILPSTTCEHIQHQIEDTLDQLAPTVYGVLGGRHHFVFIEDMNLDSHDIYDELRFLMERKGWYSKGKFCTVSGVTLCMAHTHSSHRFRDISPRALRHFIFIYKLSYLDVELQTIFKIIADHQLIGSSMYSHFTRMRLDLLAFERSWQHVSLSNYIQALRWVRYNGYLEDTIRRYFGDQQLSESKDTFHIHCSLLRKGEEGYQELDWTVAQQITTNFESTRKICNEKYPESMKFFTDPIVNPEDQRARQVYHYCQIVDDLRVGQSTIVVVERELQTVRALTYMAAEAAGVQVVSTSLADLSSELANLMAEGQSNYMATDMKFAFRQMLDNAVQEQKTLLLITLEEDTNMQLPILRTLLEFCSELRSGKVLKSLAPYRKTVSRMDLYPDQIKQVIRENMKKNVVIMLLIRTDLYTFDRGTLETPLQAIKHRYRDLYNMCRVVSYGRQSPPIILTEFAKARKSVQNTELMKDLARVTQKPLEEFALEQVMFLADAIARSEDEKTKARYNKLKRGVVKVYQIELEIEKSGYLEELMGKMDGIKTQIDSKSKEKAELEAVKINQAEMTEEYLQGIENEKQTFKGRFEECEVRLTAALSSLEQISTLSDPSPANLLLLGAVVSLLTLSAKPFPFDYPDKHLAHCKSILKKLNKNPAKVVADLAAIETDNIADCSEFLYRYQQISNATSPFLDTIEAFEAARTSFQDLTSKQTEWNEAAQKAPEFVQARATLAKKAIDDRIQASSQSLSTLETDLKLTEDKLNEVNSIRPRLQRILQELRSLGTEWAVQLQDLEDLRQHLKGNSLLSAMIFVAGLNLDLTGRERVRERTKQALLANSITYQEKPRPEVQEDVPISPFLRDSIAACSLIWQLSLPFPVFYDPFSLAFDLINEDLIVVQFSSDLRKDTALLSRITNGGSVLLLEPTEGMLQSLMPLLQVRYNNSIRAMRQGISNTGKTSVRLNTLRLEVHSEFRLYVSLTARPTLSLSQVGTVISLEPVDSDSWKTSILLQLSKLYSITRDSPEEPQTEELALNFLLKDTSPTIYSESFLPLVKMLTPYAEDKTPIGRRRSSILDESMVSEGAQLKDTYLELLAIAGDLNAVLQTLRFGEWTITPQMFRSLLLSACQEQIKEQGFPSVEQISMFTGPILYRFIVRLLWILPVKHQNVLLLCHCLKTQCEETAFPLTMRALTKGLSLPFTTDPAELATRWEQMQAWLPVPGLTWDSEELRNFHHKDLFIHTNLPYNLDFRTQAVLYCWFRQDLLPWFIETLVVQVLGRRFSFLPDNDFVMASEFVTSTVPVAVFFRKTYPVPWLKQAAEQIRIKFSHSLPVASFNRKTNRKETKIDSLLKEIESCSKSRIWLVIEGIENLAKSEIERFSKCFTEASNSRESNSDFRLWVLFEVLPSEVANWGAFLKRAYRLCFRDPKTVRENMMLAQELFDPPTFDLVSSKKRQTYHEYSQIELPTLRHINTRVTRITPTLRATMHAKLAGEGMRQKSAKQLAIGNFMKRNSTLSIGSPSSVETENDIKSGATLPNFFYYNFTLILCALRLRESYCKDLKVLLSLKEIRHTIKELLELRPTSSSDSFSELGLLFLRLVGSAWDELEFYAGFNFVKHAVLSRAKALKFSFMDESGNWNSLKYPLCSPHGPGPNIEQLLVDTPKQDHLQLIGQPNIFARKAEHYKTAKYLLFLPSIDALLDIKTLPPLQLIHDLTTAVHALLRPEEPKTGVNYEALKLLPSAVEVSKYSYFFVPDRYRASDYRTCILANKPSFGEVLKTLQIANELAFDQFVRKVAKSLERIEGYLTFKTAQLSLEDFSVMRDIARNKTPKKWRLEGPYSLRQEVRCTSYYKRLSRPTISFLSLIDFTQVMNPPGLITSLQRACAFLLDIDIEHIEFEVSENDESPLQEVQFLIQGLWLFNATMTTQILSESYNTLPRQMSVLRCTPERKHKQLVNLGMPPGIFLSFKRTNIEIEAMEPKEPELASLVRSAFNYVRTDWIDGKTGAVVRPLEQRNQILCPVFPGSSATSIWLAMVSDQPQGHWSKRGVKVDLP